ncbi:MAG: 7-cyano-7-deazaguanine synthase QueC [Steroidobacteraceae bacterium]
MAERAVVLLSGGLDSATTLAIARVRGFECFALSVEYGQRHAAELAAAARVARALGAREHRVMRVDLAGIGGSALTDPGIPVPEGAPAAAEPPAGSATPSARDVSAVAASSIPVTYVPARNTIMLSLALAWAEVLDARDIFLGVNIIDWSGYPDCRPEFIAAFEQLARKATKAAVEGRPCRIHAPLVERTKADIIREGMRLGLDYGVTVSCYQADGEGRACGRCDSCRIRHAGFEAAGVADPTRYQPGRSAV